LIIWWNKAINKRKRKAVKGNKSILPFLKSNQEPSLEYSCSEEEDNPPTVPTLGKYFNLKNRIIYLLIQI
jgi:hypothetical protein